DMEVQTSTGIVLGRVRNVLWGTDTTGERHSLAQLGMRETDDTEDQVLATAGGIADAVLEVGCDSPRGVVFVPHQAVERVSEQSVILHVDDLAISTSDWHYPPSWTKAEERTSASPSTTAR
ncbi:MAG: hypothetical protein M3P51_08395, partial [Chloroflexota bacterium]|nr:hypothetical protein [Chloroflexota bacterium]